MQQLTLFNGKVSRSRRNRQSARLRKKVKNTLESCGNWDLWSQNGEKEKEMVLFFLDVRNFTELAQKYQAFDVIHIVKKLFSTFQNIIRNYHGKIIETSGDGFYATFGFDRNIGEAATASICAGMAILEALENLNTYSFERNLHQRIEVGIGVHAGKVATGSLRLDTKDHFVVMGYPVNVASRLQAATKDLNNNFIVSSSVYKMLTDPPWSSTPMKVNLKGVSGPFELHLIGKSYCG